MVNRSMEVLEKDGRVTFLRRLRDGAASASYGIHVARLAGLSESVLERAGEVMKTGKRALPGGGNPGVSAPAAAHGIPLGETEKAVLDELIATDTDSITPLGALGLLCGWKLRLSGLPGGVPDLAGQLPAQQTGGRRGGRADSSTLSLFD
jgi:DNA mismatch repair protein MutS